MTFCQPVAFLTSQRTPEEFPRCLVLYSALIRNSSMKRHYTASLDCTGSNSSPAGVGAFIHRHRRAEDLKGPSCLFLGFSLHSSFLSGALPSKFPTAFNYDICFQSCALLLTICLPLPWFGKCFQAESWNNYRVHLICFPLLGDQSTVLPIAWSRQTFASIIFFFLYFYNFSSQGGVFMLSCSAPKRNRGPLSLWGFRGKGVFKKSATSVSMAPYHIGCFETLNIVIPAKACWASPLNLIW